ncbi:MAG TPA: hypothetical protein VK399_06165, partial [Longimicrobiaceae bacterium]|nr:hypothetical protein [Longimicrobiaceae bacterium]
EAAPHEAAYLVQAHPEIRQPGSTYVALEAPISRESWNAMQPSLDAFFRAVASWRASLQARNALAATESEAPESHEAASLTQE